VTVAAPAKVNLALVVGPPRDDGLHPVTTVLQSVELCDTVALERSDELSVAGFRDDTLVRTALTRLAEAAGVEPAWRVVIEKRIPVAAGLGGGSSDAAAALLLANATLPRALPAHELHAIATRVGADVPFFLEPGPKLAEGAGEALAPVDLPRGFGLVIALPAEAVKSSTKDVYRRFDELAGGDGYEERRTRLLDALANCRKPRDFGAFPPNDLARAAGRPALVEELRALGAVHADVSGAGPAVFGVFETLADAASAARDCSARQVWAVAPVC
jgi:4-diphosphocytidyl-2-C-methyl-D-erythritol kinase